VEKNGGEIALRGIGDKQAIAGKAG
jgi:hypothetical protein